MVDTSEYKRLPKVSIFRRVVHNSVHSRRLFGKNFYRIQKQQVPTRTVKQVIQFYYVWKKSERYDLFIQQYGKIGKKKSSVPAGQFSDFMNKCLDAYNHDSPDIHYSATTINAESKRDNA